MLWIIMAYLLVGWVLAESCLSVFYSGAHPELAQYDEKYMRAAYPIFLFLWPIILLDFVIKRSY